MRAVFDFAAANRDAAALKASALYDRTILGIDFKVGDKVLNEVNAILKADRRSNKLKVIHFG